MLYSRLRVQCEAGLINADFTIKHTTWLRLFIRCIDLQPRNKIILHNAHAVNDTCKKVTSGFKTNTSEQCMELLCESVPKFPVNQLLSLTQAVNEQARVEFERKKERFRYHSPRPHSLL